MNRRLLLQVTAPAAVIGLVLFVTCLVSAWIVNQLQVNRAKILSQNVTSLEAAQDLEINLRRLHFLSFLYLIDPHQGLLEEIQRVNQEFQIALDHAGRSANTSEESRYLQQIGDGYERYQHEFQRLRAEVGRTGPRRNFRDLADANPIRHVVEPCEKLLQINKEMMTETSQESDWVSRLLQSVLLLLGLGGPISGLILGYGIARGLSSSIYRLSVRVQDVAQRLDQDVASVNVAGDGDLQSLDKQLQHVVKRVEEVAQRMQQHQQETLRAQQLSAVGQLAASVAHEVRNPLTSIKMLVESAIRTQNQKPLTLDDLQVIHGEIGRLEHTVQSFLDFARLPMPRRIASDLRAIISQALELVRVRARQQGVEIVLHCPQTGVRALVDRNQLCTVLVNLCLNALDAMPYGGCLGLRLDVSVENEIRLSVSDTGSGIAGEMLGRLFVPFASTKATGSGLGLSISQRIMKEHGGNIVGSNRTEGGACFAVTLPRLQQEDSHANPAGD